MKRTAVIMAGGGGTRFWPLSRKSCPKQLVCLTGDDIMINETIKHFRNVVPIADSYIVTNAEQAKLMDEQVDTSFDQSHILREPMGRNTAPCVLYAAMRLMKEHGDCVMAILAADHHIADVKEYERVLRLAFKSAEETDKMVTIGLWPTFPSTGYGYIRFSDQPTLGDEVYNLKRFVEKPELARAEEYVRSKKYLWNSGMFIWKASVILRAFQEFLPEMYNRMNEIYEKLGTPEEEKAIAEVYPNLESLSIDYGIMEKAQDVLVIPAEFGWNDVGSWDTLSAVIPGDEDNNVVRGRYLGIETENCVVYGTTGKLIATIGLEDIVIVDTKDALLVCHKSQAQEVKRMVEKIKTTEFEDVL